MSFHSKHSAIQYFRFKQGTQRHTTRFACNSILRANKSCISPMMNCSGRNMQLFTMKKKIYFIVTESLLFLISSNHCRAQQNRMFMDKLRFAYCAGPRPSRLSSDRPCKNGVIICISLQLIKCVYCKKTAIRIVDYGANEVKFYVLQKTVD